MAKYEEWITPEGLLKVEGWARDGLIDEQIAHNMGIAYSTLRDWRDKFPALSAALKRGKEVVDREVENALLKRALGYKYNEDKYISVPMDEVEYSEKLYEYMNIYKFEHPDATADELMLVKMNFPKEKQQLVERKVKKVVPDTTAQIFWLKNRMPEKWRDKQDIHVEGQVNNPFAGLSTEELKKLAKDG